MKNSSSIVESFIHAINKYLWYKILFIHKAKSHSWTSAFPYLGYRLYTSPCVLIAYPQEDISNYTVLKIYRYLYRQSQRDGQSIVCFLCSKHHNELLSQIKEYKFNFYLYSSVGWSHKYFSHSYSLYWLSSTDSIKIMSLAVIPEPF